MITYYTSSDICGHKFFCTYIHHIQHNNTCIYRVPLHLLQLNLQAIEKQYKEFFKKKKIILSSPSVLYHKLAIYPKLANKPQVREVLRLLLS